MEQGILSPNQRVAFDEDLRQNRALPPLTSETILIQQCQSALVAFVGNQLSLNAFFNPSVMGAKR